MSRKITVDARMISSSGIGVVLSNILCRIIPERLDWNFQLLGDPEALKKFSWTKAANVSVHPFTQPVHSIAEQLNWPIRAVRGSDLVFCPNYNIPFLWHGPLITIVHDVAHLALKDIFRSVRQRAYARAMFGLVRRRSKSLVFVSEFSRDEFLRLVGIPGGRAVVIYNGVDVRWFDSRGLVSQERARTIIFVGNVKPHKNLKRLLTAFDRVKDKIPHTLLIVGRREGFVTGEDGISEWPERLGNRLRFTGEVSDSCLKKLVSAADALVLPSLYEGFGLPPIEAMASGCPALVSRHGSLPEICEDAALYCNPLDVADIAAGLERIATDGALRSLLRERGVTQARKFDWKKSAVLYITAMEQAMASERM